MKIELNEVSETRKALAVEIPPDVVETEMARVTGEYGRSARIPGFRPGKAPAGVIRQRFREKILHDVAHELIPRTVQAALRERGLEPLDSPDIQGVSIHEGAPLVFTAAFEVAPAIDAGDLATITIRKPPIVIGDEAVDRSLDGLRERAARYEPVMERGVQPGDHLTLDLARRRLDDASEEPEKHANVSLEVGASDNPPGFDTHVLGMRPDDTRTFVLQFPSTYERPELAGAEVEYTATLRNIRLKHLPALDDEFAKDLGQFDSLEALRARIREDLQAMAERDQRQDMRHQLLTQLAGRMTAEVPSILLEREIDRRVEEFVRRLMEQRIDPMKAPIDWARFREEQQKPALEAVKSTLVLDAIARRDGIAATEEDVTAEVERFATASGRSPAAIRAHLEREGSLGRLAAGVAREKAVDFAMARATLVPV